ncbi:MAG: class I SAM-dependent rRNA methyltransferase [Pirellulales bacterium]|nr:class I SAM-dependent rRNA methyltransferase [Pirellulales bacterium]
MTFSDQPIPLRLKPQRQFPFHARHPWVHAHSLAELGEDLPCGQQVDLIDHDGNWLARGIINPRSRLRVRLYAFESGTKLDADFLAARIDAAYQRRRLAETIDPQGAQRLVFSESDLLSGLIVDRYADCLSVQFTSGGLLRWQDTILEHLQSLGGYRSIVYRVDAKTAKHEGIEAVSQCRGEPLDRWVDYHQNELQLAVDLRGGQKTGGYLDQRINHRVAAEYLVGRRVLDVCCYTGGFGLVAAKRGAQCVIGIDSSQAALEAARRAAQRNQLGAIEFHQGDCFDRLKAFVEEGQKFDGIVLDPPRFAGSRHQIDAALRAYGRLNGLALDLLPPGGVIVTCSCSGRVSRSDFLNMLLEVGRRKRRDIVLLDNRGPAPDHPVAISCPESDYLKCVIAQVC